MLHINTCCCTCLNTENLKSVHIKDNDDIKIIEKLLYITEKDSIFECAPLLICEKCYKYLHEMYNFKKKSLKNLDLFRNCLKQLIRNPIFELTLHETAETSETLQQVPAEQITNEIMKIENDSDVDTTSFREILDIKNTVEEVDNTQSSNLVIHTVETLNNTKKYENPVAKNISKPIKSTKNQRKCLTCGKIFIRIDFFNNHLTRCSKKQLIMANLNKNNDLPRRRVFRKKTVTSYTEDNDEEESKRTKKTLERTYCSHCKKSIAVRFLNRHRKFCLNSM